MIGAIPLLWEIISATLGLGALGAAGNRYFNPVYLVRLRPQPSGKVSVRVGRAWRFGGSQIGEIQPTDSEYTDKILALVDIAEEQVRINNVLRRSIMPQRKPIRERLQVTR